MEAKRITLDELARMVKEGFERTASKAEMERGFAAVEERFDDIDTRLGGVERLLTSSRVDRIEDDIRVLKNKIGIR